MSESSPVLAVTAATGPVGSRVASLVAQAGLRPRLLVHDTSRLDPGLAPHVDAVEVDLFDAAAVAAALDGVDGVFWLSPHTDHPDPLRAYDELAESVASAVEEHRVPRVVLVSAVGAEVRHGQGDLDGLAATEERLGRTGAHLTILRCGYFFSNLLLDPGLLEHRTLSGAAPADVPLPWVAPRDIGEVAAAWLLRTDWTGTQVRGVYGPEDLSFEQAAAVLGGVLGEEFTAAQSPADDVRAQLVGLGMTEQQVEAIVLMSLSIRPDRPLAIPRDATNTTPTTLAAWAHEHLRPTTET